MGALPQLDVLWQSFLGFPVERRVAQIAQRVIQMLLVQSNRLDFLYCFGGPTVARQRRQGKGKGIAFNALSLFLFRLFHSTLLARPLSVSRLRETVSLCLRASV